MTKVEKKATLILLFIGISEGTWVAFSWAHNGTRFWHYLGFGSGHPAPLTAWLLALIVAGLFVQHSLRLPSVRGTLFQISGLKFLALIVAISAGILEEVMFRKWIMDYLQEKEMGWLIQVAASGLMFGLIHGVWGLFGKSIRAALGATIVTGLLGSSLAIVYILSARVLLPCIVAHFIINILIEPGLVLAAVKGEMGNRL